MDANGVNYYKGVLLCSRPNQSPSVQRQRPFCGRVNVQQQLGLVPTKQYGQHRTKKRQLPVLNNHKKWLQKFKKQLQQKKNKQLDQQKKKQEYLQKLRQQGRQKMKQVSNQSTTFQNNTSKIASQSPQKSSKQPAAHQQPSNPHKKKPKPAWAQTQQQAQQSQDKQVDELLDFFEKGQTQQVKDYLNDDDVKKILLDLKNKIQTLKQQGQQWKNNQLIKIQDENQRQIQQRRNNMQKGDKDDILSRISKQSGSQSVTSQKTAQRVQELQKKKQSKQWDKMTASSKKSIASVDQQIAKHIADEILRNYPNLKHHSNQSIRKLLQKQARQQLKA